MRWNHSYLSATVGLMLDDLRDGAYAASEATAKSKRETPAKEAPSTILSPYTDRQSSISLGEGAPSRTPSFALVTNLFTDGSSSCCKPLPGEGLFTKP
jgi:hypothetical protein